MTTYTSLQSKMPSVTTTTTTKFTRNIYLCDIYKLQTKQFVIS